MPTVNKHNDKKKIQSLGRRQKQSEPFHAQACPLLSSDAGMWGMLSVHLIHSSALRPGEGLQSPLWLPSQRAAQPGSQEGSRRRRRRRRRGRKRILRETCWKHDHHQGDIDAFSGQMNRQTCCVWRYSPKDVREDEAGVAGKTRADIITTIIIIISRCAGWGEVTADYHGKMRERGEEKNKIREQWESSRATFASACLRVNNDSFLSARRHFPDMSQAFSLELWCIQAPRISPS